MPRPLRALLSALFVIVIVCFDEPGRAATAAPVGQPNIVILLADDLGWADVGFRGSDIQTPNLDRLAAEGAVLGRFYATPICTPTRSALMTGRDPMKLGSVYAGFQPWAEGGISPDEHFMPESFRAAGYDTAMIGKWHLGRHIEQLTPNARGFDHFVGHLNTQIDYFDYTVAGGVDLQENGDTIERPGTYATDLHAAEAVRYLTEIRDRSKPFFLYVPFLAPHSPMQAPDKSLKKYPRRLNLPTPRKTYAAMVDSLDQAVGEILLALETEGVADNTIILFFSDNGGLEVFGASNAPLRGGKLEVFEGGVRVTALLKWPGVIQEGADIANVLSVLDIFPTMAAAAGVKVQSEKPLDGLNRLSALTDPGAAPRDGKLYFASNSPMFNRYRVGVIDGDWKLVQIIDHKNAETHVKNFLFNLRNDPNEKKNLAKSEKKRVTTLAKAIDRWRAKHPINGVRVAIVPHPGWRAPKDYAADVTPAEEVIDAGYEGYVAGVRGQLLQQQHGGRGRIKYD
ncbi:MAG: arylsulfatase [Pseudomonadota bacterium]